MFLFYVLSFFRKKETIQGGTLFKGGHYLRKYNILMRKIQKMKTSNSLDTWKVIPATVARAIFTLIAWARYFLCCGGHQKYNAPAADPKQVYLRAWGHGDWSPPSFGSHLDPIPTGKHFIRSMEFDENLSQWS